MDHAVLVMLLVLSSSLAVSFSSVATLLLESLRLVELTRGSVLLLHKHRHTFNQELEVKL